MLENQINKLTTILTDENLQNYTGECFWNLIQAVIAEAPFSTITIVKNIKEKSEGAPPYDFNKVLNKS